MDYSIPIEDTKEWSLMMAVCGSIKKLVQNSNPAMAPTALRDLIVGLDMAGELLGRASAEDIKAKDNLDRIKAIGYFDFAPDYLISKDIKMSDAAKTKAALMDPHVQSAQEQKSKTDAVLVILKNKVQVLRVSHDSLKKIAYASEGL